MAGINPPTAYCKRCDDRHELSWEWQLSEMVLDLQLNPYRGECVFEHMRRGAVGQLSGTRSRGEPMSAEPTTNDYLADEKTEYAVVSLDDHRPVNAKPYGCRQCADNEADHLNEAHSVRGYVVRPV